MANVGQRLHLLGPTWPRETFQQSLQLHLCLFSYINLTNRALFCIKIASLSRNGSLLWKRIDVFLSYQHRDALDRDAAGDEQPLRVRSWAVVFNLCLKVSVWLDC